MQGFENLMSRISRLSQLEPLAISVTWGLRLTKDRSLELAGLTQSNGLNTFCISLARTWRWALLMKC